MEREDIASYVSTEQFVSKPAKRIRSENSRKRGPNEAPLPHPQVSGGLGLGYMATSRAYLILVIQKLENLLRDLTVSFRDEDARVP